MNDTIYLAVRGEWLVDETRYMFRVRFDRYGEESGWASTVRTSLNRKSMLTLGACTDVWTGMLKGKDADEAGYGTKDDLVRIYKAGGVLRLWPNASSGEGDFVDVRWTDPMKRAPFRSLGDVWMIDFRFVEFHE
jgi:hypothetical protein